MAAAPLNVALLITADASQMARGVKEAERGIAGLGTAAKASAGGVGALAAANDQAAAAAQRAAAAVTGLGAAEVQARTQAAAATGALRMQTQNLAFQFQDIATQIVSGQSPFTILAQQLPQITMHGGKLTGVMGALRQSLAGFVSPLGLMTIGFTVAAGAAIDYFTEAAEAGDAAALSLEEQNDLIGRVADQWGDAWPALKAYNDELKRRAELEDMLAAGRAAVDAQYEASREKLPAINVDQAAIIGDLSLFGVDTSVIMEFQRAYQTLASGIEESTASGREARAVQELLLSLVQTTGMAALADYAAQFGELAVKLDVASAAARELREEQSLLDAREGVKVSPYGGGRGADPRSFEDDAYWRDRYFPKPETPARQPRATRNRKSDADREEETYSRIIRQAEQAIEMEMLEAEALAMTGEAADRLRITQELLNQARAAGISLGPEQVAELEALGATMARVTAEVQAQADAMDLRRDVLTDVIGGIRQAASDGKITLQELADIGMRALDRLIDKIQKDLLDALAEVGGLGGNSGGGVLGSILGALGLGGGGATAASMNAISPAAAGVIASGGAGLFDTGGYTGRGNPARVAGLVHEEEYVFSAPAVRSIGLGNLERMHRTAKGGRGFAEGGYTGGGAADTGGGGERGPLVSVEVINNSSNTQVREERSSAPGGRELRRILIEDIKSEMAEGGFDGVMGSRYGAGARTVPR